MHDLERLVDRTGVDGQQYGDRPTVLGGQQDLFANRLLRMCTQITEGDGLHDRTSYQRRRPAGGWSSASPPREADGSRPLHEGRISPVTVQVGFKADLDLPVFPAQAGLEPVSIEKVDIPRIWSLVTCIKDA